MPERLGALLVLQPFVDEEDKSVRIAMPSVALRKPRTGRTPRRWRVGRTLQNRTSGPRVCDPPQTSHIRQRSPSPRIQPPKASWTAVATCRAEAKRRRERSGDTAFARTARIRIIRLASPAPSVILLAGRASASSFVILLAGCFIMGDIVTSPSRSDTGN